MNVREVLGEGYIPTYTRTDITDALHEKFGFRTDYQIITKENMKKTIGISQKKQKEAKVTLKKDIQKSAKTLEFQRLLTFSC